MDVPKDPIQAAKIYISRMKAAVPEEAKHKLSGRGLDPDLLLAALKEIFMVLPKLEVELDRYGDISSFLRSQLTRIADSKGEKVGTLREIASEAINHRFDHTGSRTAGALFSDTSGLYPSATI